MKFIILSVLTYMSIGLICCTNKKGAEIKIVHTTQEKDSISSSLCKKIGIPEDMILPINSQGMDSLMKVYQVSSLQEFSDDEEEDEVRIDERYINILIPYAFNDLAKRGFYTYIFCFVQQEVERVRSCSRTKAETALYL